MAIAIDPSIVTKSSEAYVEVVNGEGPALGQTIVDRKLRFALVGCGRIARSHIDALHQHGENAEIVAVCDTDPAALDAGGKVVFGATVELEEESSGEQVRYQIVGEDEADLKQGLISIGSPIARALIGKEAGDVADVQAPGGVKRYEVVEVRYV